MAFPTGLEVALVTSIAGIIALSLFTLYLLDKLQTRIESLEGVVKEIRVTEEKLSGLFEERTLSSGQGETGLGGGTTISPGGEEKGASMIENLESKLLTSNQRLEVLTDECFGTCRIWILKKENWEKI